MKHGGEHAMGAVATCGLVLVRLAFGSTRWWAAPAITLADQHGTLAVFPAPDDVQRYTVVLGLRASMLTITAPVAYCWAR